MDSAFHLNQELAFNVHYKNFHDSISTLSVYASNTTANIKGMTQAKDSIPCVHQRLSYGGKQLKDDRSLSDYNIQKESNLQLVLCLWFYYMRIHIRYYFEFIKCLMF